MLSPQILTSEEAYVKAFENGAEGDYFGESTPVAKTFLLLDEELRKDTLARLVQLHYNYASVLNRVIHSYEWYSRAITDIDEDTTRSRQDTLDVIRESQPVIPQSLLRRALPDEKAYRSANRLLAAYRAFDGDESDDSLFSKAYRDYLDVYAGFPEIVTDKQVSEVKEGFWKWYDKSMAVPGINDIVRVHMRDSKEYLDSLQVDILKRAAEAEHDLERRAVLALELVQWGRPARRHHGFGNLHQIPPGGVAFMEGQRPDGAQPVLLQRDRQQLLRHAQGPVPQDIPPAPQRGRRR